MSAMHALRFVGLVLMTAMMLAIPIGTGDMGIPPGKQGKVMQDMLERVLDDMDYSDEAEVIVQFVDGPTGADRAVMDLYGFKVLNEFEVINGVGLRGTKEGVIRLSTYDRVKWIEYNEELEYMMHETTNVINATTTWNSKLYYGPGDLGAPIDGTGVTAVILDSGIDAGHPDLDYKEKVIMNLKSDSDNTYTEVENSDTSSGHGTHCAGTVAGNGDASQSARRGVAPGASLIGLSTGETVSILNAVGALEWVYDHTKPYNNPYNVRVVSNSWGSGGEYDPNNAINLITRKTALENNVVLVFAAGNAGGDGTTNQVNPYSLEPSVISIAAFSHEGNGIASFSSRGDVTRNETWPDVGAPGVNIWATEARGTLITAMKKQGNDTYDSYYMAISGTSMATPHTSGVVSLLWEAAPSMHMSNETEEFTNESVYGGNTEVQIHEAELILKLTASHLPSGAEGVPTDTNGTVGLDGRPYDYAQGYGMVNVHDAVALALTLEELRRNDTTTTVWDAYRIFKGIQVLNNTTKQTNKLYANWWGDWSRMNDGDQNLLAVFPHRVFIPNGTEEVEVNLAYKTADSSRWSIGEVSVNIDFGDDGTIDQRGSTGYMARGSKTFTVPANGGGVVWSFYVTGQAVQVPDWWNHLQPGANQYREIQMEYTLGIMLTFDIPEGEVLEIPDQNLHSGWAQLDFMDPDAGYSGGSISLVTRFYDLTKAYIVEDMPVRPERPPEFPMWIFGVLLLLAVLAAVWYKKTRGKKRKF